MRYLLIFMLLVGLFVVGKECFHFNSNGISFGFGVKGEGPVKNETRNVSDFHAVEMSIAGDVEVSQAETYFVEVQAQENLLPILKTEVSDGKLKIYFSENVSYSEGVKVRVSAPAFDRFSLGGSGTIKAMTPIRTEKMALEVAGSGDIFIEQCEFGSLETSIAGSGSMELGGKANSIKSEIAGSGDVRAKNLTANELNVEIAGSGSVTCDVAQTLKASIAGSGDVYYSGQPVVEANVSGSGSVKKLNEQ